MSWDQTLRKRRGWASRPGFKDQMLEPLPPKVREASCCGQYKDALGRYPIGYCSPDCERRPQ